MEYQKPALKSCLIINALAKDREASMVIPIQELVSEHILT